MAFIRSWAATASSSKLIPCPLSAELGLFDLTRCCGGSSAYRGGPGSNGKGCGQTPCYYSRSDAQTGADCTQCCACDGGGRSGFSLRRADHQECPLAPCRRGKAAFSDLLTNVLCSSLEGLGALCFGHALSSSSLLDNRDERLVILPDVRPHREVGHIQRVEGRVARAVGLGIPRSGENLQSTDDGGPSLKVVERGAGAESLRHLRDGLGSTQAACLRPKGVGVLYCPELRGVGKSRFQGFTFSGLRLPGGGLVFELVGAFVLPLVPCTISPILSIFRSAGCRKEIGEPPPIPV
jgi:hypothetical protein